MRHVAILSPSAPEARRRFWLEAFGGMRVPVVDANPADVIYPNGERGPGYFVNFRHVGEVGQARFIDVASKRLNGVNVLQMVQEIGYPVMPQDVTIVSVELPHVYRELAAEGWI